MSLIAIDSGSGYIDVPAPSSMTTIPNELVKSSRNALGNLYKFRINVKTTISLTWNVMTSEDKTRLLSATSGNSFSVKYFDMTDSTFKFGTFYRGSDLDVQPLKRFDGTDFDHYTVKMSLVEF